MKFNKRYIWVFLIGLFAIGKGFMFFGSADVYNNKEWDGATIYLIPTTHADPYWKGEWAGPNIGILHDNIMDALEMIQFNPDFRYTVDQHSIISTFIMEHPEYEDDLREAIVKGQIEVAGGGVSQADLNIPNGEGFIRNLLIGNQWFEDQFGVSVNVGWQVDTFGAAGTTPTILSALDYKYLYFWRDARNRPSGAFWWVGPDGSRTLCWRTKYGRYPMTSVDLVGMVRNLIEDEMADTLPSGTMMLHIGGDKAAPHTHLMDYIQSWNVFYAEKTGYRCKVATPSEFFEAIEDEASGLPSYGYGQDHNPYNEGAYASYIETKVYSRLWESNAQTAELFSVLGRNVANISSIREPDELDSGWVMNSFFYHHDTVTGTSPYPVVEDFLNDYRSHSDRASKVLDDSLTSFGRQVNTTGNENSIIVFNSESMNRSEIIEISIPVDLTDIPEYGEPTFDINKIGVEINQSESLEPVAAQVLSIEDYDQSVKRVNVAFQAEVDSIGYKTYGYSITYDELTSYTSQINHTESVNLVNIDNGEYNITWDMSKGGDITSLMRNGKELVPSGESIGLTYVDTSNDLYDMPIKDILGRTSDYTATYHLVEGPILSEMVVNVTTDYYRLIISYKITLNNPRVDLSVNFEYLEKQYVVGNLLLMNWPWSDESAEWTNGAPYGWTDHTADRGDYRPYPATFWSATENTTDGLAIYDRGLLARDWNTAEDVMSIALVHQNDPARGTPGESDPLNNYEKEDFEYSEINNFTVEFGFEYYDPAWWDAEIPQKGRSFNHELHSVIITDSQNAGLSRVIENSQDEILPKSASFMRLNASNVVLGTIKTSNRDNGIVCRFITYPTGISGEYDVNITMSSNSPFGETPVRAEMVSALEKPFGSKPADPSINTLQSTYTIDSSTSSVIVPSSVFGEATIRTFFIPYSHTDCLPPDLTLDLPLFASMYTPVRIKLTIADNSSVFVSGYYSEDAGATWNELPEFEIASAGLNSFEASTTIVPTVHGRLRLRIFVHDSQGNLKTLGEFNTTYSHLNTLYADREQVSYHYPQIRVVWPVFVIIPLVAVLVFIYWLLLKPERKGAEVRKDLKVLDDGKDVDGDQAENEADHDETGSSLGNRFLNWRSRVSRTVPVEIYVIITFLFGLFLFAFVQQITVVYDYSDITDVHWFDEYVLDLMQFVRRNNRFYSIYLTTTFISLLMLTIIMKYKYKRETSALVGLAAFSIPLIALLLQIVMILLFGDIELLPSMYIFHEVLHLYDNLMLLMFHIFATICPILIPRLFSSDENRADIEDEDNQRIEDESKGDVDEESAENSELNPNAPVIMKKMIKWIWYAFSWGAQFTVFCYFTTIIMVDYFTHYLDGEALGSLSAYQAYVIWVYYMFAIILFAACSIIASLLFELLPKKARKPWSLKHRIILVLFSQLISIFAAYFYYIGSVQYVPGIIQVEPEIFFLLLPTLFLSIDTMLLILIAVSFPHVIVHLVFYPAKSVYKWRKEARN